MTTSDHPSGIRLRVDHGRCVGHNVCLGFVSELLDSDERGTVSVQGDGLVPEAILGAVQSAVDACPETALSLEVESWQAPTS